MELQMRQKTLKKLQEMVEAKEGEEQKMLNNSRVHVEGYVA